MRVCTRATPISVISILFRFYYSDRLSADRLREEEQRFLAAPCRLSLLYNVILWVPLEEY